MPPDHAAAPLRALVLGDPAAAQGRLTLLDHLHALDAATEGTVNVTYANPLAVQTPDPRWFAADFVVLHTTVLCNRWLNNFGATLHALRWLERYKGIVVGVPQDEYDHAHLLDEWLDSYQTDIVVTCFSGLERPLLYPRLHKKVQFVQALTGYVNPARVRSVRSNTPKTARTTDVFYRARFLPEWFGWLGWVKGALGVATHTLLRQSGLRLDVSVRSEDTLTGDSWLAALAASVGTLGSESGSSVLDRRGETQRHVRALLETQPGLDFQSLDRLTNGELTRHHFAALGPRHLEAMMTETVQLLVEGRYGDQLRPWEHYIPLRADLSDLPEKADLLRDERLVHDITQRCFAEFVNSPKFTYRAFADKIVDEVHKIRAARSKR